MSASASGCLAPQQQDRPSSWSQDTKQHLILLGVSAALSPLGWQGYTDCHALATLVGLQSCAGVSHRPHMQSFDLYTQTPSLPQTAMTSTATKPLPRLAQEWTTGNMPVLKC